MCLPRSVCTAPTHRRLSLTAQRRPPFYPGICSCSLHSPSLYRCRGNPMRRSLPTADPLGGRAADPRGMRLSSLPLSLSLSLHLSQQGKPYGKAPCTHTCLPWQRIPLPATPCAVTSFAPPNVAKVNIPISLGILSSSSALASEPFLLGIFDA